MSFIVSVCLSSTTLTGGTVNVYSDSDNFTSAFTSTTLSQLEEPNCPVSLEVPDGTSQLLFVDTNSLCSTLIDIQSDLCSICGLGLSNIQTGIGSFSCGSLTGTCGPISDYVIYWYGPDDQNQFAFSTGEGLSFPYSIIQPFSIPLLFAGTYYPVIQNIKISGITFSLSGENNTVQSNLDCLDPITITDNFTCENGSNVGNYAHSLSFYTQANGAPPQGIRGKFIFLSSTTEAFAYGFQTFVVPDNLKIYFSGSAYSDLIVLEDIIVGDTINTNVDSNTIPKKLWYPYWDSFKKVLPLTGLTINNGDFLIIEIIPNQTQQQTSWKLDFTCTEIDCPRCMDNFVNSPYKIVASSVFLSTGDCNTVYIAFDYSGCTTNEVNNNWVTKYFGVFEYLMDSPYSFSKILWWNNSSCHLSQATPLLNPNFSFGNVTCYTSGNYIKFEKDTSGNYYWEFSDYNDFILHFNKFNDLKLNFSYSTNPNSIDYYVRAMYVHMYGNTTGTTCGDATYTRQFYFHPATMLITTGTNLSNYVLEIHQPILTKKQFTNCELNCDDNAFLLIYYVNSSSSTPFTSTTNVGLYNLNPINLVEILTEPTTILSAATISGNESYVGYSNVMIPYSGNNVVIDSLTTKVCSNMDYDYIPTFPYINFSGFNYRINLINPNNISDFEILSLPIINHQGGPNYELAYQYSGGQVTYSSSTYCI